MEVKDALGAAVVFKYLEGSNNYVDWSIQVHNYLVAKDLWDTIETTAKPPKQDDDKAAFKAWSDKNSMALRVIESSCWPNTFSEIGEISFAKDAWNTLAEKYLPKFVLQLIGKDNYVEWSDQVKDHLMAHDLWDIVEATTYHFFQEDDYSSVHTWRNSMALHVIQNSCNLNTLFEIRDISSAKVAWNTLAEKYLPKNTSSGLSLSLSFSLINAHAYSNKDGFECRCYSEETPHSQKDNEVALKAWSKKNCTALHVIQISCGTNAFSRIKKISTAKIAWNALAEWNRINVDVEAFQKVAQNWNQINVIDHEAFKVEFEEVVRRGDWNSVEEFMNRYPGSAGLKITGNGGTALHVAVDARHGHIVKKLAAIMSKQELVVQDKRGWTALFNAFLYRKKLARYLYSLVREEYLKPEKDKDDSATLCCRAINTRNLDIALDLIERFPSLALARVKYNHSPLYALVSSPSAFPSENRLVFWKRWMYKC
ncbi:hypothetical protein FH972_012991 [Carpinus fangiana]|uniref:DUF4219 domain-containing protein n=1 Tax=Carpinus fangiana TaxID=176857 RepID=A0A5N6R5C0_9ROSI|nr:hypothetical protein FH972_012991 [Carpinus fangiana]